MRSVFEIVPAGDHTNGYFGRATLANRPADARAISRFLDGHLVDLDGVTLEFEFWADPGDRVPDLIVTDRQILAVSPRAMAAVAPLIGAYAHERDGHISGAPYRMFLPLYCADIADYARSAVSVGPDKKIDFIASPKTRPIEAVLPIFRIRHSKGIYCNEAVAGAVTAHALTGVSLRDVNGRN